MKIADFIRPELVMAELTAGDKPALIEEMARHFAAHVPGFDGPTLARALMERERLASTAIDQGVAIPHAKLKNIPQLIGCVGRKRAGVDFESMDGQPTFLFFVLVAPENATGVHLKALARISRLFRNPLFRQRLMEAPDAAALYQTIVDEDAKQ